MDKGEMVWVLEAGMGFEPTFSQVASRACWPFHYPATGCGGGVSSPSPLPKLFRFLSGETLPLVAGGLSLDKTRRHSVAYIKQPLLLG